MASKKQPLESSCSICSVDRHRKSVNQFSRKKFLHFFQKTIDIYTITCYYIIRKEVNSVKDFMIGIAQTIAAGLILRLIDIIVEVLTGQDK